MKRIILAICLLFPLSAQAGVCLPPAPPPVVHPVAAGGVNLSFLWIAPMFAAIATSPWWINQDVWTGTGLAVDYSYPNRKG